MSAPVQAITNGARADAQGVPSMSEGSWVNSRWGCPQLVIRPRARRPALAIRQDA
ncbi:hypothetical protein [Streptomyces winkii]|uniref:hypothetical protein n=1 Tax=Streptomyces winkii TaxID=3051178 RepID=UPI0028D48AAE|nr:hypothetical protein [Streptomyces sp. DSM 40971]